MKKNKMMRIASVLLVAVLLSTCAISGTFAKYVTSINANDSAIVAKFAVEAFGTDAVNNDTATVKIFDASKIYDTYGLNNDFSTATGTDDVDVKNQKADGKTIIAPGTWGTFSYTLSNTSDVAVTYAIDYTVDEKGVPLLWSLNGKDWTEDLADVVADTNSTKIAVGGNSVTINIYWQWMFEQTNNTATGDATDTALGNAGTAEPTITIDVTFTQVD